MNDRPKLGTRGSALALAQAGKVASAIEVQQRWPAGHIEIVVVKTSGDAIQDRPLAEVGGKGLWTKELDRALLAGEVDFCVHSMKDVETDRPKSIRIAAIRPRGDVRERLIGAKSVDELKKGATVGTSSPRRAAQLKKMRPDLEIVPLRGNIDSRLAKVTGGELDAILLASVGIKRLGLSTGMPIPVEVILPAPCQGALGLECRADDAMTAMMLKNVDDASTHAAILAERAFTRALGASCHSPVAALATNDRGKLKLRAQLLSEDGKASIEDEMRFECDDEKAPVELARRMLEKAPKSIRKLFAGS